MTRTIEATLEIDAERGVIYVHSKESGITKIRIGQLPKDKMQHFEDDALASLDITIGHGLSFSQDP